MFVIAGATGHVGRVVAEQLLAHGKQVRIIVRNAEKAAPLQQLGAELAVGDLNDTAFLMLALSGTRGFFVLLPTNYMAADFYQDQCRAADSIASAVAGSRVPHVVMLSSAGAELSRGTGPIQGLHYLEQALRRTPTQLTALRPVHFLENIGESLQPAREHGIFPNFFPSADHELPMVASRDVAMQAVRCLLAPAQQHEVIDVVGPSYTPRAQAELLGRALGKALQVVDVPEPAWLDTLTQAGLPPPLAVALTEMQGWFVHGQLRHLGDRLVRGTTRLEQLLPELV